MFLKFSSNTLHVPLINNAFLIFFFFKTPRDLILCEAMYLLTTPYKKFSKQKDSCQNLKIEFV